MKKQLILILSICLSITSCDKILDKASSLSKENIKVEDLKVIRVNDNYSISAPDYMTEMKSLHDEASFRYANIYKETYTIVIDEDKQEFIDTFKEIEIYNDSLTPLENYSDYQIKSIQESIEGSKINEVDFKIKNYPSKQYEFSGKVEGINIAYLIGFVESDDTMYMMMSWTIDNRYKKYKNTFKLIQNSIKIK